MFKCGNGSIRKCLQVSLTIFLHDYARDDIFERLVESCELFDTVF